MLAALPEQLASELEQLRQTKEAAERAFEGLANAISPHVNGDLDVARSIAEFRMLLEGTTERV